MPRLPLSGIQHVGMHSIAVLLCIYTLFFYSSEIPIDPALTQPTMPPQPATHVCVHLFVVLAFLIFGLTLLNTHQSMSYSHYQAYGPSTHYAQTPYGNHFHPYQPPAPTHPATVPTPTATVATTAAPVSRQPTQGNETNNTDIASLNDALGSAGVDLRVRLTYTRRKFTTD